MRVNPADAAPAVAATANSAVNVRVVAGNLAAVPVGALLQAVVAQVTPREAVLTVNGEALTVRASAGLAVGEALLVRVPNGATGTLEIADANAARAPKPAAPQVVSESPRVEVVDVLATRPDGRVQVRIGGQEHTATPAEPLAPGGRFVL